LLEEKTFFPEVIKPILKDEKYKNTVTRLKFSNTGYFYNYKDNKVFISIDLNKDYSEDVIFFSKCIGGKGILNIFTIIKFTKIVKDTIKTRLSKISESYISVHIRNTDRKSDTKVFMDKYKNKLKNSIVFVASDNLDTIEEFKAEYKDKIITFSNIPDFKGKAIHENSLTLNKQEFILDCIADIIILCYGKEYYFSCPESNYSKNVELLRKNIGMLDNLLK
jgi:hypothetical protein